MTAHHRFLVKPPREASLEERFHRGDREAFEALVRPHLDTMYTLCLRLTNCRADAEDLVQEALIRAVTRHDQYDPSRPFRPWLLTIAGNLCRDHTRTAWWRRVLPVPVLWETAEASPPEPEHLTLQAQRDAQVRDALATLPPPYRMALALYYLDGMTGPEMAEITGLPLTALKQRVCRGKEKLRLAVEKMYPGLEEHL